MDYIRQQAESGSNAFTRAIYAELAGRLARMEQGDPEYAIEPMRVTDLWPAGIVMLAIIVYYLLVVGLPS